MKKTLLEKAIEQLEDERAVIDLAILKLREQQQSQQRRNRIASQKASESTKAAGHQASGDQKALRPDR